MKRLILMRHAKTEDWYQGIDDESRALVRRGWSDAKLVADVIAAKGWLPDHVIMSSARRTRETWTAMSDVLAGANAIILEELYLIHAQDLFDLLVARLKHSETLLVLGHNPGVHELALSLAVKHADSDPSSLRHLASKMPTSGAALFENADLKLDESDFKLVEFVTAKPLRDT